MHPRLGHRAGQVAGSPQQIGNPAIHHFLPLRRAQKDGRIHRLEIVEEIDAVGAAIEHGSREATHGRKIAAHDVDHPALRAGIRGAGERHDPALACGNADPRPPVFYRQVRKSVPIVARNYHIYQSVAGPCRHIKPQAVRELRLGRHPHRQLHRMTATLRRGLRLSVHGTDEVREDLAAACDFIVIEIGGRPHPIEFEAVHVVAFKHLGSKFQIVLPNFRPGVVEQTLAAARSQFGMLKEQRADAAGITRVMVVVHPQRNPR